MIRAPSRFPSKPASFLALCLAGSVVCAADGRAQKENGAASAARAGAGNSAVSALLAPEAAAREAEHLARFDQAIAPARGHALSEEDAKRIREAISVVSGEGLSKVRELREGIKDPVGRKLVDWFVLRAGYGEAEQYRAFLDSNPAWPDRALLTQRYEEALFTQGGSARAIREAFAAGEPRTGAGFAALASAYLAEGDEAKARTLAAKAWRDYDIAATLETGFLERFGRFLTPEDHKWRLDRLLIDDTRWSKDREERAPAVRRLIPLLPKEEQKKAEARLAVYLRSPSAAKLMAALPQDKSADWGLAYQRLQLLRRQGKSEESWKILLSAPTDAAQIVSPDDWWTARRAAAYEALAAGKPKLAFDLVRDAGRLSVNPLKEQAGLAGWIALRHLEDPHTAEAYFRTMRQASDGPLSISRAEYWLGRAREAMGNKPAALENYRAAAGYVDTFFGQLARSKLEPGVRAIALTPPEPPTPEMVARFNALDAVRAVVVAHKAGLDPSLVRPFYVQLQRSFSSEPEVAMVAHLAQALGDTQMAVRVGKAGIARGMNLIHYAYPVHAFPSYSPLRPPPETAVLLGIARQESEFNTAIVSGAGARGILQVMPVTARHVCKDYKIKCDIARLLKDPAYNTMMASAYIGDRMAEFSGSYILTLSGYNAGPGRTRQWIREFGDPRHPSVDPIDWIMRIPFEETREYVQKVLSNIQIYRARLGEEAALRVHEDISRARAAGHPGASANTDREG
jgi:soluble lytic murein transglycosylase